MSEWFLDDGPLGFLAKYTDLSAVQASPRLQLHVMEAVAKGAKLDRSGKETKLLAAGLIQQHSILMDTAASDFLERLRPNPTNSTNDLGEHESIAFCATVDRDAVFVTLDKGAAYLALAELGRGRVATPFDLWIEMLSVDLLTNEEVAKLNEATAKRIGNPAGVPSRFLL